MHISCAANLDAPLKKQKSLTDCDAVVENASIKEDDGVSQAPVGVRTGMRTHAHKEQECCGDTKFGCQSFVCIWNSDGVS